MGFIFHFHSEMKKTFHFSYRFPTNKKVILRPTTRETQLGGNQVLNARNPTYPH